MRTILYISLAAAALLSSPAVAATRNFGVTSFEKIRVEGPYQVQLATGVAPFARATGSSAGIDRLSIDVQGTTLIVRTNPAWGGYPGADVGPVTIELGTHDLGSAWVRGSGSVQIGKARAQAFVLSVEGSGTASISQADVDQLRVAVSGSGLATVAGRAGKLSAVARGAANIDTTGLAARDADIGADGPSTVKANVTGTAKINASGVASVVLTGNPACTSTLVGSASVSGCKPNAR